MNRTKQIAIILTLLLSFSCSLFAKPIRMIYLIPEGFTGGVVIFYNDEKGTIPEEMQDGSVVYRIPQNGILIVKSPKKRGPYELSYFYVNKKDIRTEIEYLNPRYYVKNSSELKSRNNDEVTEVERNSGFFAMNHRSITASTLNRKILVYAFSIGHPKDSTSLYIEAIDKSDQIEKDIAEGKVIQENY
jgi:hypothetical protein